MLLLKKEGRLESKVYEKDGKTKYITEVIAERVTFLSSNKKEENKTFENE